MTRTETAAMVQVARSRLGPPKPVLSRMQRQGIFFVKACVPLLTDRENNTPNILHLALGQNSYLPLCGSRSSSTHPAGLLIGLHRATNPPGKPTTYDVHCEGSDGG